MRIKFEGAEADQNRLEAYEGLKSIDGLMRVARIATHYAATGEVRHRAPYTAMLETHITQIQNGSFEMLFENISMLLDQVQASQTKAKAEAVFNRLIGRGTGQVDQMPLQVEGQEIPSGDIDAMAEAAEAALQHAHRWINSEQKKISVVDGADQVKLDSQTKSYVEKELVGDERTQDVSVAALNVNNRTGRVYLFDQGRTVPFLVHKDAAPRTIANLSRYLSKYAQKTGETVGIRFRPVGHIDGRLKRLILFDCVDLQDVA